MRSPSAHLNEDPLILIPRDGQRREEDLGACPYFHLWLCWRKGEDGAKRSAYQQAICCYKFSSFCPCAMPRTIVSLNNLRRKVLQCHGRRERCADA